MYIISYMPYQKSHLKYLHCYGIVTILLHHILLKRRCCFSFYFTFFVFLSIFPLFCDWAVSSELYYRFISFYPMLINSANSIKLHQVRVLNVIWFAHTKAYFMNVNGMSEYNLLVQCTCLKLIQIVVEANNPTCLV